MLTVAIHRRKFGVNLPSKGSMDVFAEALSRKMAHVITKGGPMEAPNIALELRRKPVWDRISSAVSWHHATPLIHVAPADLLYAKVESFGFEGRSESVPTICHAMLFMGLLTAMSTLYRTTVSGDGDIFKRLPKFGRDFDLLGTKIAAKSISMAPEKDDKLESIVDIPKYELMLTRAELMDYAAQKRIEKILTDYRNAVEEGTLRVINEYGAYDKPTLIKASALNAIFMNAFDVIDRVDLTSAEVRHWNTAWDLLQTYYLIDDASRRDLEWSPSDAPTVASLANFHYELVSKRTAFIDARGGAVKDGVPTIDALRTFGRAEIMEIKDQPSVMKLIEYHTQAIYATRLRSLDEAIRDCDLIDIIPATEYKDYFTFDKQEGTGTVITTEAAKPLSYKTVFKHAGAMDKILHVDRDKLHKYSAKYRTSQRDLALSAMALPGVDEVMPQSNLVRYTADDVLCSVLYRNIPTSSVWNLCDMDRSRHGVQQLIKPYTDSHRLGDIDAIVSALLPLRLDPVPVYAVKKSDLTKEGEVPSLNLLNIDTSKAVGTDLFLCTKADLWVIATALAQYDLHAGWFEVRDPRDFGFQEHMFQLTAKRRAHFDHGRTTDPAIVLHMAKGWVGNPEKTVMNGSNTRVVPPTTMLVSNVPTLNQLWDVDMTLTLGDKTKYDVTIRADEVFGIRDNDIMYHNSIGYARLVLGYIMTSFPVMIAETNVKGQIDPSSVSRTISIRETMMFKDRLHVPFTVTLPQNLLLTSKARVRVAASALRASMIATVANTYDVPITVKAPIDHQTAALLEGDER